ncbi:MAG: hypothetical protein GY847_09755 [Proteobacteria bacterium]|nr:hypothetical protein [Pseudomonadota bacterium]
MTPKLLDSQWRITKRMQRDATTVPTGLGWCRVSSFADCQQLDEGAPLIRKTLAG